MYNAPIDEIDAIVALASYDSNDNALLNELFNNSILVPFVDIPALVRRDVRIAHWHNVSDGAVVFLPSVFAKLSNAQRVTASKKFEDIMRDTKHPIRSQFNNIFIINNCYVDPVVDDEGDPVCDDSNMPLLKVSLIVPSSIPMTWLSSVEPKPCYHGTQRMYRVEDTVNATVLTKYCAFSLASWYKDAFDAWRRKVSRK